MQSVFHDASLAGSIMFIILSLAFSLFGKNIMVFTSTFAGLLACFFLIGRCLEFDQAGADGLLAIAGFTLYFFGLLIVRAIILRSVSLHLLLDPNPEVRLERMKFQIDHRLADLARYNLAVKRDEQLTLTFFGKIVAGVTGIFYRILGQRK